MIRPRFFLSTPPDILGDLLGGSGRAKNVWKAVVDDGVDIFGPRAEESGVVGKKAIAALRVAFPHEAARGSIEGGDVTSVIRADDETTKLLVTLHDGFCVETVLIPTGDRVTICVSSQVGCARGCSFCSTGRMGLLRNLAPHEILQQLRCAILEARSRGLPPVTNVVFMGMGEPADNIPAVSVAVAQMTSGVAFRLGKSHISVSTVGPSPTHIRSLVSLPARLAWSVHGARDDVRRQLVPTTRYDMTELRDAFRDVLSAPERGGFDKGLFVEVALVAGVNDGEEHATELAELLRTLPGKTRVNLLPFNPFAPEAVGLPKGGKEARIDTQEDIGGTAQGVVDEALAYQTPTPEVVRRFQQIMYDEGYVCTVRTTRGANSSAACGQLASADSAFAAKRSRRS